MPTPPKSLDLLGNAWAPSQDCEAITPSDQDTEGTNFRKQSRGIYVGGAGDVVVVQATPKDGEKTVLFSAVPAGTILPVVAKRVNSTNTTATNLVALM